MDSDTHEKRNTVNIKLGMLRGVAIILVLSASAFCQEEDSVSDRIEELEALGYLSSTEVSPAQVGVIIHEPSLAYQGYNIYTSAHAPIAVLMDMDGTVLHEWSYPSTELFPDYKNAKDLREGWDSWTRGKLLENGDLLAIVDGWGLLKLDKESNLLWVYRAEVHHNVFVERDPDTIYILTRKADIYSFVHPSEPVLNDFVCVLDRDGNEIKKVSILHALRDSPYAPLLKRMPVPGDILHTNTLQVLDGRLAHKIPAFRKGNILLSIREINTVCVLDLEMESIVWAMSSLWQGQHEPTVLDNGNMIVFDNSGTRPYSRVIEFDPVTQEIVWMYQGDASNEFYSRTGSSARRLPNGNTLITESESARAFEVTPDKRVVWKFVNPHKAGPLDNASKLFDVVRIAPDFPMTWLQED